MKEVVEMLRERKEILNILIHIHEGFDRTIGYLLVTCLCTPIGLFMSFLLVYGVLTGKLIKMSGTSIITLITCTIFFDVIGGMTLFNWLSSNFSKERIIIDKKEMEIIYCKMLFGRGKTRVFKFQNINEIKAEAEPSFRRYERVYPKCYIKHNNEKFRFGYFASLEEGRSLGGKMNSFIYKNKVKH